MTTDTQTSALNRLFHSEANVRHTGKADGVEGLAAYIAAQGLRQNLNVAPRAEGKGFEVVAGGRRLRALKHLAKTGHLAKDAPIPCRVLSEGDAPPLKSASSRTPCGKPCTPTTSAPPSPT